MAQKQLAKKQKRKRAPGAGRPPRKVLCSNCSNYFSVTAFRKHVTDCREQKPG
jgi:hypothetical protein